MCMGNIFRAIFLDSYIKAPCQNTYVHGQVYGNFAAWWRPVDILDTHLDHNTVDHLPLTGLMT